MNLRRTLATTQRIFGQLRHDRRTVAMMIGLPALLIILMRYVFNSQLVFEHVAPSLLGIFPFIVMFLITSVAMLRERTSGTLERLMAMPIGKLDLLLGYGLAFGTFAVIEVALVTALAVTWLGLTIAGPLALLVLVATLDALLGMALGLFVSAFARTEFQAVQFMPLIAAPQILLCGLFVARDQMATVLLWLSDVMPLSYAVDAVKILAASPTVTAELVRDIVVVAGCVVLALTLGATTLRRRTP
ncbi:MAG TPA: ABC transporter permease [Chloroflexota bacterium]|nr:ABC transporter permease [Chloroflexota bacterium]